MIFSIIIGILAGYIACKLTNREGKGLLVNLFLGVLGGFMGNFVLGILDISWGGLLGEIGTAVIGAILVLWLANKLSGK